MILLARLDITSSIDKQVRTDIIDDNDVVVWTDKFGRKWQLIPNTNAKIMMPFIMKPYK